MAKMTSAKQLALVLLGALCIAAAAVEPTFLADTLVKSRLGTKAPTQAKTSSYYGYGDTEIACLNQMNFKSCRYTGCASSSQTCGGNTFPCLPTNIFVQTDFTCCPKEHHYGYEGHDNSNIGVLGFSDKIGTCDWEVSIYRWLDPCDFPTPVLTDDGTAVKLGTAWGTCYLNSEADNCDDPLCERMAISVQGGLYISKAYGTTQGPTVIAMPEETCAGDPPLSRGARRAAGNTTTAPGKRQLNPIYVLLEILAEFFDLAGCPGFRRETLKTVKADAAAAASEGSSVEAKIAYSSEHTKLYEGCALIVSGPFYETSKHDNKIEETGLFEFTPFFTGGTEVSEPTANIPIVTGKAAKIRFTREREGYYGGEEGHHEK